MTKKLNQIQVLKCHKLIDYLVTEGFVDASFSGAGTRYNPPIATISEGGVNICWGDACIHFNQDYLKELSK